MKTWFNRTFILLAGLLIFAGCEKEEERAIFNEDATTTLSANATSLVLTEENADEDVVTFLWTPVDFGFQAATTYSLEFDFPENDFGTAKSVAVESNESTLTARQLNVLLIQLGYAPDVTETVSVRISAVLTNKVEPVTSNVLAIEVTPYSDYIEPVFIYAPGAYQGWSPTTADSLASVEDNGIYIGYINFTEGNLMFKFTTEKAWDLAYGDGGEGKLSASGGDLSVPSAFTYKLEVNLNELTWSAEKYSWAIIGDATPNGWSDQPGQDTDMRYSHEDQAWKIEADLTVGEFKFRLNDDWGVNYGDDDTSDEFLSPGGANIPIAEAGRYSILLNLSDSENPAYLLEKIE